MSDFENPIFSGKINSNNYFINCYTHLSRIKGIHFLFILIEILLNIFYELETFLGDFHLLKTQKNKKELNIASFIANKCAQIPLVIKCIIILLFIIIFDSLYIFIRIKHFKMKYNSISILVFILEIIYFRPIVLLFLNLFFTLHGYIFVIGCFFLISHMYIIISNFLYNHLYYFVPEFIDYPYDEFSSLFDMVLLIIKFFTSISGTINNNDISKFFFLIVFIVQIFFSIYILYLLRNHSYLFMKNSFLNRTRILLFFTETIIIIIALLFGKNEIMTILFLIICISVFLIFFGLIYFIYNPYSFIKVRRETPMENMFFYLFILSEKNDYDFFFENKIKEHYEICGICDLCGKFKKYLNRYKNLTKTENDENAKLINEDNKDNDNDNNNINTNNNNKIIDLFDIIYDNKNKYFYLIKKIVSNYKNKGNDALNNNSYYYINLSFLIYSDYKKNEITLSLNERILLEFLNKENQAFLDYHNSQINQLLYCNNFISLSLKILNQIKDIINSEPNIIKAKKLIDLSALLKTMKNKKYKDNIFCHKLENISNSRHIILICSLVYEEIFNTTLNNSQLPIRDNLQVFEDVFIYNSNKINKIISLALDITNNSCKIIRAGKDLYSYINTDLFDLFPLIFKQYQINKFLSSIFEMGLNKEKNHKNKKIEKRSTQISTKNNKIIIKSLNNKNKKEYIEIKLILCENISSKMYYKLITLKLTPLFNNDINHILLFDGQFWLQHNTLITIKDFEEDNINIIEKIVGVSSPELESLNETYSMSLKKYIAYQKNKGVILSKTLTFNISYKIYNIYILMNKERELYNQLLKKKTSLNKDIKDDEDEEEEQENESQIKNTKINKMQYIEDTASAASAQTASSYSAGMSNLGIRNKKKDNIYDYGGFNRIKKINSFVIVMAILFLIFEYFYLKYFEDQVYNNNMTLYQYRDFTKLYFQLFSSILGVTCIYNINDNKCIRLVEIFDNQYKYYNSLDNNGEYFNYTLFVTIQNKILAEDIMEKRNYLAKIHKFIGNKKYNELFGKKIEYFRIMQNITNSKLDISLTKVSMDFSEAILIICNSFQILAYDYNNIIYILNKFDDPFSTININNINNEVLSDYQKELYEMILNYKYFYSEFKSINDKIIKTIKTKADFITIFSYCFITADTFIVIFVGTLMLIIIISFENILTKIINYINMIMNMKNDDFNFCETYNKKIEHLEMLLEFYSTEPTKEIQKLNNLYGNYQQYLTIRNKNNAIDLNKKNYKKIMEDNKKNELDNIPKNQIIITRKDVKSLGITSIYLYIFYFIVVLVLGVFALLLSLWKNYFTQRTSLYSLLEKNIVIEDNIYRAVNSYDLMIFQNLTIDEITKMLIQNNKNEHNLLLKNFYEDIALAFDIKEKKKVQDVFQDFETKDNFTCEKLFELNNEILTKIENKTYSISNLKNVKHNLICLCNFSRITDTNDYRTVFEKYFHNIKNGIILNNDYSYKGLVNSVNEGTIARISIFFDIIIINVLKIAFNDPHKNSIDNLIKMFKQLIELTHILYLLIDIIEILIVV